MDTPRDDAAPRESILIPLRIVTDWKRFSSGLWRIPEGDIAAAYCADVLPRLKVFGHEGRLFTNGGSHFGGPIRSAADCYPLVPFKEYSGRDSVKYSYEGREGTYRGSKWRLGPKVIFESTDPTVPDWIWLFRVLYADGGFFAHGVSYAEFLGTRVHPESPNERAAHTAETDLCETTSMPLTQCEMAQFLIDTNSTSIRTVKPQLELSL